MIRVLLADDQPLIRTGLRALLDSEDDLEVVAEADDGQEAVAMTVEHVPDIVLMEVQMPALDEIDATRRIVSDPALAATRVVILTNYGLDEYVFAGLRAGASGFLIKDAEPEDLLQAVRVVAEGAALLSPAITRTLISEFVARPTVRVSTGGLEHLTPREREVVTLVGQGLSNNEIAAHMVIHPTTAKTHVSRAMTKVHARDRAQLVIFAYETGLVLPRSDDGAT